MRNVIIVSGWICALLASILAWNGARTSRVFAADSLQYLNPKELSTSVARYSHVIAVPAGEDVIFVSAQGRDDLSGRLVSKDVVARTKQTVITWSSTSTFEYCGRAKTADVHATHSLKAQIGFYANPARQRSFPKFESN